MFGLGGGRHRSLGTVVALSVVATAALGACGAQLADTAGPTGGATAVPGPCELVTPADIDAALALEPGTAQPGDPAAVSSADPAAGQCSYLSQTWGGLVVMVSPTLGVDEYESTLAAAGDRAERLEIGDGAFWLADIERGYFLKGPALVIVQITRLVDELPLREPTVKLGEAAVERL
jgi:hypothetical protein